MAQPLGLLETLPYRERRVLELRYGLGGEHPRTLDEVGRAFNVTRERIRQIENQSLEKLQNLREAQKLRDEPDIELSVPGGSAHPQGGSAAGGRGLSLRGADGGA